MTFDFDRPFETDVKSRKNKSHPIEDKEISPSSHSHVQSFSSIRITAADGTSKRTVSRNTAVWLRAPQVEAGPEKPPNKAAWSIFYIPFCVLVIYGLISLKKKWGQYKSSKATNEAEAR